MARDLEKQPKGRVGVTPDLQLCLVHIPPTSVFVSTCTSVILYLKKTETLLYSRIMILFLVFITILGEGGMFIAKPFTYFCIR